MKYAPIAPLFDLDLAGDFEYSMILAWMANNEIYSTYYKNKHARTITGKDYHILDNGANENKMIDGKEYIKIAQNLQVDEIIAPDVYHDANSTLEKTRNFIRNDYPILEERNVSLMAVPQGENLKDLLWTFDEFLANPRINVIGIGYRNILSAVLKDLEKMTDQDWIELGFLEPEWLKTKIPIETFNYTLSRLYFMKKYNIIEDVRKSGKKIHCLGLYNPVEISLYSSFFNSYELETLRSYDSAIPFQAAQVYMPFKSYGVKTKPRKYLDMFAPLGKGQREIAEFNIEKLVRWGVV